MESAITRKEVLSLAWPLILANTTAPLLGLADTAVLGHSGDAISLASISLGTLLFSFIYWGFGFLRMTTTAFVAQATAAGEQQRAQAAFLRPLCLGGFVGVLFIVAREPISSLAWSLFNAGKEEEALANAYFMVRIWGAPATLAALAGTGVLIGRGCGRQLLLLQVATNGLNLALDVVFVCVFHWGAVGVGWGTAISEWFGALLATGMVIRQLELRINGELLREVFLLERLRETLQANTDVMIRTLAMICGFAYFTDRSSQFGANTLAANHILLQFISLGAFFLDGFAHVAESLVGAAKGRGSLQSFDRAVRQTTEVAVICALSLALSLSFFGTAATAALTDLSEVRALANAQLAAVVAYMTVSVFAFQLDGIFLGTTSTRPLRNAAILSLLVFLAVSSQLVPRFHNTGLWWSFVAYVAFRGTSLSVLFFRMRRDLFFGEPRRRP